MKPKSFRVQMYKSIIDSNEVEITPLTVIVGKNEAGKTSLLKALHKFNPFKPNPFQIDREWPRGRRTDKSPDTVVCAVKFTLEENEKEQLKELGVNTDGLDDIRITKDYAGKMEVQFPDGVAPDRLHPNEIDSIVLSLPQFVDPVLDAFKVSATEILEETKRLAREGRYTELGNFPPIANQKFAAARSPDGQQPQFQNENAFISAFSKKIQDIIKKISETASIRSKAHDFIISKIPTFVYMDEYRTFDGFAHLDQLAQREERSALTPADETVRTILNLSGLNLKSLVTQGNSNDREQRQYDLSDGAATLTSKIEKNWGQLKYEVQFNADGQQFYTFVKDIKDPSLIRLEERSKGFQWFFSFDLLLMHETKGTLKDCVILLDEPGLHLHPEGQLDLLKRLEAYASDNTLIYSSHLPFMIDLQHPERIRILSETDSGSVVRDDLYSTQPEGKLTLQAALGISGKTSFLLSDLNLVVEGVDDYWIIMALSNYAKKVGLVSLADDIMITAAGGASEVTYISTLITGQELAVVALYDSDEAGITARDGFIKKWLAKYKEHKASAITIGEALGHPESKQAIEDVLGEDFYLKYVVETYKAHLATAGISKIELLQTKDSLAKKVESYFEKAGLPFNKGSVSKRIRSAINEVKAIDGIPALVKENSQKLIQAINKAMESITKK